MDNVEEIDIQDKPAKGGHQPRKEKAYGYTFDNSHEASIEASFRQLIAAIHSVSGPQTPPALKGAIKSTFTEALGFLHKWHCFHSYLEKAIYLPLDTLTIAQFIVGQASDDFGRKAYEIGFHSPTNSMEDWVSHFLGFSKSPQKRNSSKKSTALGQTPSEKGTS